MSEQCVRQVYGGSFVGHRCIRKGKVKRDGKWYCGMHDPVASEEKRKKRHAVWDAEWEQKRQREAERLKRVAAIERLCGHIATEDLEKYELKLKERATE